MEAKVSLRDKVATATAYRTASRVDGLPSHEKDRLVRLEEETCFDLVSSLTPRDVLEIVEILGAHVKPGHEDNRILFAVRAGIR